MLVKLISQKKPSKSQALILAPSPQLSHYSSDKLNSLIYSSQVHYLNDAYFFAKEKLGSIQPCSVWHITDNRYFLKNLTKIDSLKNICLSTFDTVSALSLTKATGIACVLKNLGRDGFSNSFGQAYHGCSVLHEALQYCYWAKYEKITLAGVILPPPMAYKRVNSSSKVSLPQFVYFHQLKNLSLALQKLRKSGILVEILDSNSVLHFL